MCLAEKVRFANRLNIECERKKYVRDDLRNRGSIGRKTALSVPFSRRIERKKY